MLVTRVQKLLTTSAAALIGLALGSTSAFATALPITDSGVLQIGNINGVLVGVTTSPFCINWGGGSTCVANTTHQMSVSGSSNLFSTTTSATDQIKDLTGSVPVVDFETVLGAGALAGQTIHFDMTSMPNTNSGAGFGNCGSNAANNSCSPPNSPFVFAEDNSGSQVTISFTNFLNAYTGTSASGVTPYRGIFTTQISGTVVGTGACSGITASITTLLGCEAAGGTVQATWSATESPLPSPEPISFVLFGSGLVGVALFGRRSRKA